ncbi:class I SAM-dependent methyltransferase [Halorhabdus sp. CBA1104]|uniref:class I SAM-dependent methyltransferase n=1 Tax=Halorhabdus sp. CBA1104 TaxID=1380432 RepID=UPI0012B2034C|nr:class I SAM-dependent methyltransferase [Halorhabdus sp. CBA1104]QGN07495.1 class I SAM-dependent methyltransferase [Halorhabdus sp. CBA1104]
MDPSRNRRGWAERTGEFSPAYYADLGPNKVSNSLVTLLEHYSSTDASILELGCSSGRHLAHLRENGFDDLTGIDINDDAFDVMADAFPAVAETGTFHTGAIEDLVPEFPDDAFDVVYSVETLQHVHPDDAWVFDELARISGSLLVTVENEGPDPDGGKTDETITSVKGEFPMYRRNWGRVFTDLGLEQLLSKPGKPDTIRAFTTA